MSHPGHLYIRPIIRRWPAARPRASSTCLDPRLFGHPLSLRVRRAPAFRCREWKRSVRDWGGQMSEPCLEVLGAGVHLVQKPAGDRGEHAAAWLPGLNRCGRDTEELGEHRLDRVSLQGGQVVLVVLPEDGDRQDEPQPGEQGVADPLGAALARCRREPGRHPGLRG